MAIDEVRVRITNCGDDGCADTTITESGFLKDEDTLTEGSELALLAEGGEFEIVYVGDKEADA